MTPLDSRVAMIGLDAADIGFIESHLDALPNLSRLFAEAPPQRLTSTADLLSGSVWPSFYTGQMPGHHGLYHHMQWRPAHMRFRRVSDEWLPYEPFWNELPDASRRAIVFDAPVRPRADSRAHIDVVNWGPHDVVGRFGTNTPEVRRLLQRGFEWHPMGFEVPLEYNRAQLSKIEEEMCRGATLRAEVVPTLLEGHDWSFFLTVFGETHRAGHILWPDGDGPQPVVPTDALLRVYQAVDAAVGRVVEHVRAGRRGAETSVVVFALHGMGPNTTHAHFVPELLARHFAFRRGEPIVDAPGGSNAVAKLRGIVPAQLQRLIAISVPRAVRDWVVDRTFSSGHDWSRTDAFALVADLQGYVRLNLRERERDGRLEPESAAAAAVQRELAGLFTSLSIDGAPLCDEVVVAKDVFEGERLHLLPDLILKWRASRPPEALDAGGLGELRADVGTGRGGNHRPTGFAAVAGPLADDIQGGENLRHICDLSSLAERALAGSGPS